VCLLGNYSTTEIIVIWCNCPRRDTSQNCFILFHSRAFYGSTNSSWIDSEDAFLYALLLKGFLSKPALSAPAHNDDVASLVYPVLIQIRAASMKYLSKESD
jgi:hypothetical protein